MSEILIVGDSVSVATARQLLESTTWHTISVAMSPEEAAAKDRIRIDGNLQGFDLIMAFGLERRAFNQICHCRPDQLILTFPTVPEDVSKKVEEALSVP
ncbi:MAG: hypothetical protein WCV50_01515 [Patescibacteria group bacterium]|jgi:hypothetical protein